MVHISFDYTQVLPFVSQDEINLFEREFSLHQKNIYRRQGKGSEFLGWVDLPGKTGHDLFSRLEADAHAIREESEVVVIVGIGGSYLGARAVIEALSGPLPMPGVQDVNRPEVVYAGHHLDAGYHQQLLKYLDQRDYSVIVISKSGTTTEPAIAFRLVRKHIEEKYGIEAGSKRIYAITDAQRGALKKLSIERGYTTYDIPDDIGGRYSVLTPVGLLPIAVAGFDVKKIMDGARAMAGFLKQHNKLADNPAASYAVIRNILYNKGKTTEILVGYNPSLMYFIEWWKQLFGESEGKDDKGIFPAGLGFTTDLHSMGQYIQEGLHNIFETVVTVGTSQKTMDIPSDDDNLDGLNYLSGRGLDYVNAMAVRATMMAHVDGGVPNLEIHLPAMDAQNLGELIYFFEMACAISGYILDVNPFDQPGVESYKRNMFALLGKPGFEKETKVLRERLKREGFNDSY